jgi:uncharacterized protein (DUF2344 family)
MKREAIVTSATPKRSHAKKPPSNLSPEELKAWLKRTHGRRPTEMELAPAVPASKATPSKAEVLGDLKQLLDVQKEQLLAQFAAEAEIDRLRLQVEALQKNLDHQIQTHQHEVEALQGQVSKGSAALVTQRNYYERVIAKTESEAGVKQEIDKLKEKVSTGESLLTKEQSRVRALESKLKEVEQETEVSIAAWKKKMDEVEAKTKPVSVQVTPESEFTENLKAQVAGLRLKVSRLELAMQKTGGEATLNLHESNLLKAWVFGFVRTHTPKAKHSSNTAELPIEIGLKVLEDFELRLESKEGALQLHSIPRDPVVIDTSQTALRNVRKALYGNG